MKLGRFLFGPAMLACLLFSPLTLQSFRSAHAADAKIDQIQNFVMKVCIIPPMSGSSREEAIKGNFDATLPGFLKHMADLGIHLEGSEVTNDFQGVAHSDLAASIADGNKCREDLASKLIDRMPAASTTTTYSSQANSSSGNCSNNQVGNGTINNNCNNTYNLGPPHLPNALYQNGQQVGMVSSVTPNYAARTVTFSNPRIDSGSVDLSQDLQIQGALVSCPDLANDPDAARAAHVSILIAGTIVCRIVGPAP